MAPFLVLVAHLNVPTNSSQLHINQVIEMLVIYTAQLVHRQLFYQNSKLCFTYI